LGDKPRHGVCWYTSPAYDRWSEAGRHLVRYAVLAHSVRHKLLSAISIASSGRGLAELALPILVRIRSRDPYDVINTAVTATNVDLGRGQPQVLGRHGGMLPTRCWTPSRVAVP